MTVKEIIKTYLREHGYDGLYNNGECGCEIDDIGPCESIIDDCRPGYKVPCDCEEGCAFHIKAEKDAGKVGE